MLHTVQQYNHSLPALGKNGQSNLLTPPTWASTVGSYEYVPTSKCGVSVPREGMGAPTAVPVVMLAPALEAVTRPVKKR